MNFIHLSTLSFLGGGTIPRPFPGPRPRPFPGPRPRPFPRTTDSPEVGGDPPKGCNFNHRTVQKVFAKTRALDLWGRRVII